MGIRSAKTSAIIFIILFLGYYQRWLYVPLIEAISGSGRLTLDPDQVPRLVEEINQFENVKLEVETSGIGKGGKLIVDFDFKIDPKVQKEAIKLSQQIQRQLELGQRGQQNIRFMGVACKQPKLICGAPLDCNLGCQIHYVMTCVMVAYLSNRTLIMNWDNWPYHDMPWSDIFLPIGLTDCPLDNYTATVLWTRNGLDLSYPEMKIFPYKSGLPIPTHIGETIKKLPTIHLLWWNSQFAQFAMRLQLSQEEMMKKLKTAMKLYLPTVGILMRKRDKLGEKKFKTLPQSIDKYMTAARKYFTKLEELTPSVTRRIFISTDDRNIIKLVKKRYRHPKWEILGMQLKTDVEDMLKDIYLLAECDYVVCSFSSDICRLVMELKESRGLNSTEKVKSLDLKYTQALPRFKKLQYTQKIV